MVINIELFMIIHSYHIEFHSYKLGTGRLPRYTTPTSVYSTNTGGTRSRRLLPWLTSPRAWWWRSSRSTVTVVSRTKQVVAQFSSGLIAFYSFVTRLWVARCSTATDTVRRNIFLFRRTSQQKSDPRSILHTTIDHVTFQTIQRRKWITCAT